MPVVNLKGVSTTYQLVEDGDYDGIFTKYENAKTRKGDNMVVQTYTIAEDGESKGRKLFRRYTLTENALWAWKADAIVMGADPDELEDEQVDTDKVLDKLLNNNVRIRVSHHADPDDENKVYNDVELIADNSW